MIEDTILFPEHIEEFNVKTYTEMMRENPWIISTLVLGITCLILIFWDFI